MFKMMYDLLEADRKWQLHLFEVDGVSKVVVVVVVVYRSVRELPSVPSA